MVSPSVIALFEDVLVRFRKYSRATYPELSWSVVSDLNGTQIYEKKLRATMKAEPSREALVPLIVRADAGGAVLAVAGAEARLPADDATLRPTFEATIRSALLAFDDQMPDTRP